MSPETQILLSGALTFGVPLVLAVRELIVLRRPPRGGWRPEPTPPAPTPPLSPAGQKPLPDCLIPKPVAGPRERVRELEPA
jgi:hypothetical protein